jgi:hypothetical protein
VLTVGDQSLFCHRVVLAMVSKMWRAQFGRSGMAESKSNEVELEDMSFDTLKSIIDFAYTGKVAFSGSTVVAIIQAANRLQVELVERAAVDFLVERLDAGNVLDAMALGEHLSVGARGRDLRDKSRAWLNKNVGLMAAEPSFRQLPATEVASLVESDELEVEEEDVFSAVMAWVKEDEAGRKAELTRLLPLVRFPMMADGATAINAEPLVVAQQPTLAYQLMFETHPSFRQSAQAATCPRLVPRKGQRLLELTFTRVNAAAYDVSAEGGALLKARPDANNHAAICAGHVMKAGRHAAEFTVVKASGIYLVNLGVARPGVNVNSSVNFWREEFWGLSEDGRLVHNGNLHEWEGQQPFKQGDVVGLLLDCDAGTLTVKKNGARLGVARTGLTGEFCWAATLWSGRSAGSAAHVRIAAAQAARF